MTPASAIKTVLKSILGERMIERIRARAAAGEIHRRMADLEVARRSGVPVFLDARMRPCWVLKRGRLKQRLFIATIPKAGTHMMAMMLTRFGLVDCRVHVMQHGIVDHRFAPERLRRYYPAAVGRSIPLGDSIRLIAPGQFAFGHIGLRDAAVRAMFADFKVVAMYRNLRDAYASLVRYFREIRRDTVAFQKASLFHEDLASMIAWDLENEGPARLIGFRELCAWRHEPNALPLYYEDVVGDRGRDRQLAVMRDLRAFLGSNVDDGELADILNTVIGQPTMTKTDRPTIAAEHWTDEIERTFRRIGFTDLNRELGYDE